MTSQAQYGDCKLSTDSYSSVRRIRRLAVFCSLSLGSGGVDEEGEGRKASARDGKSFDN